MGTFEKSLGLPFSVETIEISTIHPAQLELRDSAWFNYQSWAWIRPKWSNQSHFHWQRWGPRHFRKPQVSLTWRKTLEAGPQEVVARDLKARFGCFGRSASGLELEIGCKSSWTYMEVSWVIGYPWKIIHFRVRIFHDKRSGKLRQFVFSYIAIEHGPFCSLPIGHGDFQKDGPHEKPSSDNTGYPSYGTPPLSSIVTHRLTID